MPEQEISKEVKIEVIADLLKRIIDLIAKDTGVSPEILLPMMQKINDKPDITMDNVYSMAAEGFYNRLYKPQFMGTIISMPIEKGEDLPELQQKWDINTEVEDKGE